MRFYRAGSPSKLDWSAIVIAVTLFCALSLLVVLTVEPHLDVGEPSMGLFTRHVAVK
jgi:hypothetical protein